MKFTKLVKAEVSQLGKEAYRLSEENLNLLFAGVFSKDEKLSEDKLRMAYKLIVQLQNILLND